MDAFCIDMSLNEENKKTITISAISIATFVILWEFVSVFIVKDSLYLPSFHSVFYAFLERLTSAEIYIDALISFRHFFTGGISAILIGIPIGIIMGWYQNVFRFFNPIIEILRPIPPLAWIPFAIIWLKLTHEAAGMIIFIGMVFPIIVNTYTGFRNIPKIYVEAAKVLGCTKDFDLIRHVAIPAASPMILSGIRVAMGTGWMCLVSAEMFGVSDAGIGYSLWHFYSLHRMELVVLYMFVLGFMGLLIDVLFRFVIEKNLLKWQKGTVI